MFLSLVEGTYFLVAKLCFIYSAINQTQILQYLLNMNTFFYKFYKEIVSQTLTGTVNFQSVRPTDNFLPFRTHWPPQCFEFDMPGLGSRAGVGNSFGFAGHIRDKLVIHGPVVVFIIKQIFSRMFHVFS